MLFVVLTVVNVGAEEGGHRALVRANQGREVLEPLHNIIEEQ